MPFVRSNAKMLARRDVPDLPVWDSYVIPAYALVAANRELITRFEKKIQATLARIWGEKV